MTAGRPLACLLALLAAGACARRTEIIGRLIDGSVPGDGRGGDGDGGDDAPAPGDAGDAISLPLCPPPAVLVPAPTPAWNCPGQCWREAEVDPALFGAPMRPAPARPPEILYPLANSTHPPNLPLLTIHWRRALVEQTSFRLSIEAPGGIRYDLYVPRTEPPGGALPFDQLDSLFAIPESIWRYIGQRHAGTRLTITVTAHDALAGVLDVSAPLPVFIARDPIEGGFYYMTLLPPGRGIQRHLFGTAVAEPLIRPGSAPFGFDCAGCHAVGREGGTVAFAATYDGNLGLLDTARPDQPRLQSAPSAFAPAISPDGRLVVGRNRLDHAVSVYQADSGARLAGRDASFLGGRIDFPSWSPTGRELVATRASLSGQPQQQESARDGDLVLIPFINGNLGVPQPLLSDPERWIHSYPSFSPDGEWIVFTSSPAGSETLGQRQTRLRLIHRSGTPLRELTSATFRLDAGSKFARFAPTGTDGCRSLFIAFQSGLDHGVIRRNAADWIQLWLSAIDLTDPGDPSRPPVWLPFQDHRQENMLPAWSDLVPCTAGCVPGARCDTSRTPARCVPN